MSKNRIKKTVNTVVQTREEAEARMRDLAIATNQRIAIVSEMDEQLLSIKKEYEQDIARQDALIKQASDDLEAWALAHPELFQKPKSIAFLSGVIGFRTGTPKLKLLRGWTWDKTLEAIQQWKFAFVRTKEEVDKESIIAFCATESDKARLAEKVLRPIGVALVQDEGVFIEPTLTPSEVNA